MLGVQRLLRHYSLPLYVGLVSCLQTCYVRLLGCAVFPGLSLLVPRLASRVHVGCQG